MEKLAELKKLELDKLKNLIVTLRKESFNLRFQRTSGQLEKTSRITDVRKQIARIKTLINEKSKKKNA